MAINETLNHSSTPVVASHVIAFQMRIVSVAGKPAEANSSLYKLLRVADEHMFSQLPSLVSGWRFTDHDDIECDRLELYETEFAQDEGSERLEMYEAELAPEGAGAPESLDLYEIAMSSTRELPVSRAGATKELPLSIEQLMEEVPTALQTIYSHHGVQLELVKVRFYKTQTIRQQGIYTFS